MKKSKSKSKPTRPLKKKQPRRVTPTASRITHHASRLPAADAALAHRRELETLEDAELRSEICSRMGDMYLLIRQSGDLCIQIINNARELGLFIKKDIQNLPGGQFTLDFWQQRQHLYRTPDGQQIQLEHLKWCVKVTEAEPEPITDFIHARSWQREFMALAGFNLEGQAPGREPAPPQNHYLLLNHHAPRFGKELEQRLAALAADPHYGPLKSWKPEDAKRLLDRLRPAQQLLATTVADLEIAAATTVIDTGHAA